MAQQGGIVNLYAELNRLGQKQEYEKAIRTANKILAQNQHELAAFKSKVVSFMLLERFDEALAAVNRDKIHSAHLKFEKAYCEYRLNRTKEALTTLRSIADHDIKSQELLCQVLYRIEEYEECYSLYRDLMKNSQDDFDDERETNLAAVIASLQLWGVKNMDNPGLNDSSYEMCYNKACYLIGRGELTEALDKLAKAEGMVKEDPDLTEEDLDEELAILRVQRGYIQQCLHQNEAASQLYNLVLKTKPSDSGLVAVVSNNVVTLNKDQNIFDSKRKMKAATADSLRHKTVSAQRQHINHNQCLVHMYSNQGEQCHLLARKLQDQYPDLDSPVLIRAAQMVKDKKLKEGVALLREHGSKGHGDRLKNQLITAQLYLGHGHVYQACKALRDLEDEDAFQPGIVSALVTLYLSQEDKDAASDILIKAVDWHRQNQPKSKALMVLTKANADFQMKHGNPQEATRMLEDLRKANPGDALVVAQLISSYAQFNPSKAQQISKDLPNVGKITKGLDVDALEAAFSTLGPKYMKKQQQPNKGETSPGPGSGPRTGDAILMKKKQRKKKKGKLPKNCEPGSDIDAERWLPRRERSYFRGKRRDKRKDVGKGTQGMNAVTAAIAESLDASRPSAPSSSGSQPASPRPGSGATSSPQPQPAATAASPAPGPRQQKPVQANKKKKKGKGNRW